MKILVVGGMHGNEPLGLEIVKLFKAQPVKNVTAILANERAIVENRRFVKRDLNRTFPGDRSNRDYETLRAAVLLEMTKGYDVVLDFHNTHCPGNDCGFIGDTAEPQLKDVAMWLGLKRVIVADYDCINKYAPRCLSVEISLSSPKMSATWWRRRIVALAKLDTVPLLNGLEAYSFVYRMTLIDRDRFNLPAKSLRAFQPIPEELARRMGVESPAYPIFIGDGFTPYNYGGLLNKLN